VTRLSDAAVERLRDAVTRPELPGSRYEVLEAVGRGGMATIFRARDRELGREVALKVVSVPDAGGAAARLRREAEIIARLEHPGIVPVHDVGALPDGRVFYVMKLVRGRRLDEAARAGSGLPDRLRVFLRVCEAVAFAHAHGVVHRDLKPENVMVGPFGEVLVMDWGVAKVLAESGPTRPGDAAPERETGTGHGTVLGTPGYMAPEQARRAGGVGPAADVYALGGVLYFLLTLRAPAPGVPQPPRRLDGSLPRALEAVCLKALHAEPEGRYEGASALAADVERYLDGAAVSAYREGPLERAARFVRRHQTLVLLLAAYLVMRVLLGLLAG
jgi:serine/threonine-protein kinase